jgi:hypothetical protein
MGWLWSLLVGRYPFGNLKSHWRLVAWEGTRGSPVAGTFSYFVSEGGCVAMLMLLAILLHLASQCVPCRAC